MTHQFLFLTGWRVVNSPALPACSRERAKYSSAAGGSPQQSCILSVGVTQQSCMGICVGQWHPLLQWLNAPALLPWPINFNCLGGERLKQNMIYKGKLNAQGWYLQMNRHYPYFTKPTMHFCTLPTLCILPLYLVRTTRKTPIHPTKSSTNKSCLLCPFPIPQAELTAILLCSNNMSCLPRTCY